MFRVGGPDDQGFIHNSWLKSHYDVGSNIKAIGRGTYADHHRDVITKCLSRSQILIACDPEVESLILGWIVFEAIGAQVCIHYLYVRGSQRRFGIGRRLYEASRAIAHDDDLPVLITHLTPNWQHIDRKAVFNPYMIEESSHAKAIQRAVRELGTVRRDDEKLFRSAGV